MRPRSVAVVGGGWAGCAAAAALSGAGTRVVLHEAAAELGGRARRVDLELAGQRHALDNGQHLMIGAYTATARLLAAVGVVLDAVIERRPFELRYADGFALCSARLPAPWHLAAALLRARGLALRDRVAIARLLGSLKKSRWNVGEDREAAGWLADHGQSPALIRRVWRPLTVAALNTAVADASAQILANVLRDSLGAVANASELWLPRSNLSALLPEAVERFVASKGGSVRRKSRVELIERRNGGFHLTTASGSAEAVDAVVYAAPPSQLHQVAAELGSALDEPVAMIGALAYEPIVTAYLKYRAEVRLQHGFVALLDDPARGLYGQWAFDRGALDAANRGVIAVIISASGSHAEQPLGTITDAVARQLQAELGLPPPLASRAIIEKRATLKARPGLQRPANATAVPGFVLAGDWTASDYPSTLEAAVRSGEAAARLLMA